MERTLTNYDMLGQNLPLERPGRAGSVTIALFGSYLPGLGGHRFVKILEVCVGRSQLPLMCYSHINCPTTILSQNKVFARYGSCVLSSHDKALVPDSRNLNWTPIAAELYRRLFFCSFRPF